MIKSILFFIGFIRQYIYRNIEEARPWTFLVGISLPGLLCCSKTVESKNEENFDSKPNIILILTDDQGCGDVGFNNNPYIKTPHLDSLAKNSTRFTNFYVCPVCAPTRASLMTGRYSIRTGIYDTYNGGAIMSDEEVTIAEILKDNGYETGIFGKWHLGDNYPFRPIDQGFNESLIHKSGGIGQVGDVYNYYKGDSSYFNPTLFRNGKPVDTRGYCSDVFTEGAIEFIKNNIEKSFFIYLSYNAPHVPLQLPAKYYEMYDTLLTKIEQLKQDGSPLPNLTERELEIAKRVYGMVTNIDDNIGRLVETLRKNKLINNTIIIFLTDNGPQHYRYNCGLRDNKSSVYEGGVKVPCFVHYPKLFPRDFEIETPSAHIDILPTIADICEIDLSDGKNIDGMSLLPLIEGKKEKFKERSIFFHWNRGYPEPYRNIAIRKGKFKLIGHTSYSSDITDFELFNLSTDPYEQRNIVSLENRKAKELKDEFDNWIQNALRSEHLVKRLRVKIGSDSENPVILNRNDAKGVPGIWSQDRIFGYWDVEFIDSGNYNIEFHFKDRIKKEGSLVLKLPPLQWSLINVDTTISTLELKDLNISKGKYMLQSYYRNEVLPFYIVIKKE